MTRVAPPGPPAARSVSVALPVPIDECFHYLWPGETSPCVGQVVSAPFGRRTLAGVVVELDPVTRPDLALKPLRGALTDGPVLEPDELGFLRWVARYYRHPLGQVVATALPPTVRSQRVGSEDGDAPAGWRAPTVEVATLTVGLTEAMSAFSRSGPVRDRLLAYLDRFGSVPVPDLVEQFSGARRVIQQLKQLELVRLVQEELPPRLEHGGGEEPDAEGEGPPPELTPAQRTAVDGVSEALKSGEFSSWLLHGVTGSGKTEVYLRLAQQVLDGGGGVLVLVPEIALTPQLVSRFVARLNRPIAVLHSGLTPKQRVECWRALRSGHTAMAIGARSAVFAPVRDLGLVVVDEEHDGSYKQDDGLRYHARDVAVARAARAKAVCVLGSATPALESLHNADVGKYRALSLPERVAERPMPEVQVVDLREERGGPAEEERFLTPTLVEAIEETAARGEQAILLLNRRGLSTLVVCGNCGGESRCTSCDTSMTYHGRHNLLRCHYCGRAMPLPARCPLCEADALELLGEGTERVEEALSKRLPGLRVDRMDRDTTAGRGGHAKILDRFRSGEIQVLVGTQMVAKGHDFPRVTLVGVLHADAALRLPDFRAGERTFALLTQVAGRAGRAELPGRVIVQTYVPDHDAIRFALQHDFEGYARKILRAREALGYPPFGRIAMLRLSHPHEGEVRRAARTLGDAIRTSVRSRAMAGRRIRLLGPAPSPIGRIAGRQRWQLLLLAPDPRTLAAVLDDAHPALRSTAKISRLRLSVDVDPQSML